jgi:uncharacterized membrane protein YfcA
VVIDLATTLSGFAVGAVVGMTGIGGGALMTPLLVLVFGVAPQTAVGTDLLFASATKVFGVLVHGSRGTVDWSVVRRLAMGSLPAALLTVAVLALLGGSQIRSGVILHGIGLALAITALGLAFRKKLHQRGRFLRTNLPERFKHLQPRLTTIAGAVVGTLVSLTSVGAGALGTVALTYLYPFRLTPVKLIGTDLAHAIPLALVAGAGHLLLGNIDFALLGNLLLGSIPGIVCGALLSTRAPEPVLRHGIAVVLMLAAGKLLF